MRIGIFTSALIALLVLPATAGIVIDTRPDSIGSVGITTTDWVGQTFTATGPMLTLFGFELHDVPAYDLMVSGAVYNTDGTVPTDLANPLFTSAPVAVTALGTYSFSPNLALSRGTVYAIAAQVTGGTGEFWGTSPSVYADGTYVYNAGGQTPWFSSANSDGSVVIAMTPEPGTFLLFGIGLAGCALVVRRRRRR